MGSDMFGAMNKPAMARTQNPILGGGNPMAAVTGAMGGGNGGSFAQKQPMQKPLSAGNAWQANRAQRSNTGLANPMAAVAGQVAGAMGSRPDIMQRQQALKQQAAAQPMAPSEPVVQHGLQDMASRLEQSRKPAPVPESIPQQQPQMNAMQAAQEQMRGYEGPDLGSQDPRELARVAQMNQGGQLLPLQGMAGGGGGGGGGMPSDAQREQMRAEISTPGIAGGGGGQPDVMPRGIGPSAQLFGGEMMGGGGGEQQPQESIASNRFAAMNKPMRVRR